MTDNPTDYTGDDAEDVKNALERQTHDGPGDEQPGDSDFKGFATEGVETGSETDGDE